MARMHSALRPTIASCSSAEMASVGDGREVVLKAMSLGKRRFAAKCSRRRLPPSWMRGYWAFPEERASPARSADWCWCVPCGWQGLRCCRGSRDSRFPIVALCRSETWSNSFGWKRASSRFFIERWPKLNSCKPAAVLKKAGLKDRRQSPARSRAGSARASRPRPTTDQKGDAGSCDEIVAHQSVAGIVVSGKNRCVRINAPVRARRRFPDRF
jgi:hypothetical protein